MGKVEECSFPINEVKEVRLFLIFNGFKVIQFSEDIYALRSSYLDSYIIIHWLSSVQSLSHVWHFVTPWTAARQATLSIIKPGIHPHPCPLSPWFHTAISSSVVFFSSCPLSFPASGSFPMSQLFTSFGQNIGASALASILPMNIRVNFLQDWLVLSLCCPIKHCPQKIPKHSLG